VERYRRRLSGPLRDRFDLVLEIPALPWKDLEAGPPAEPSAAVRVRVSAARRRQLDRQGCLNGRLDGRALRRVARLDASGAAALVERAVSRFGLSARAVARVLRVARTLADLDGAASLGRGHVAEALQFRAADLTV
jgi:magnesium chelatase family protein